MTSHIGYAPGTGLPYRPRVLVSYLVRLVQGAAQKGEVIGQVQVVSTGEEHIVRNEQELLEALSIHCRPEAGGT